MQWIHEDIASTVEYKWIYTKFVGYGPESELEFQYWIYAEMLYCYVKEGVKGG